MDVDDRTPHFIEVIFTIFVASASTWRGCFTTPLKKNTFRIGLIITVFLWNQSWNLTRAVSKISSYDYDVQQVCTIWWQFLWWKSPVTGYLVSGGGGSSTWRLSSGQPSAGGQRRRAWGASAVEHQAPACWQSPGPPSAHSGLSPHKIYLQWNL